MGLYRGSNFKILPGVWESKLANLGIDRDASSGRLMLNLDKAYFKTQKDSCLM